MKRLLFIIVALVVSYGVYAIDEAEFYVQLMSCDSRYSIVQMAQSGMYTDEKNPTDMNANITNTTTAVNIYACANYGNMSIMTSNHLMGTYLGFTTNSCTSYSLNFDLVSGHKFYIKDHYNGDSLTLIQNGVSYGFTAEPLKTFNDRFEVMDYMTYHRQVLTNNWGTICFPYEFFSVEHANLYQIAGIDAAHTELYVDPVSLNDQVAGTAYLFQALDDHQEFNYYPFDRAAGPIDNNGLVGTWSDMQTTEQTWFVKKQQIIPALATSTVSQYRAYIPSLDAIVPVGDQPHNVKGRLIFKINNGTNTPTELVNVNENENHNGKVMINGQLVIIRDGKMYNAQGARL